MIPAINLTSISNPLVELNAPERDSLTLLGDAQALATFGFYTYGPFLPHDYTPPSADVQNAMADRCINLIQEAVRLNSPPLSATTRSHLADAITILRNERDNHQRMWQDVTTPLLAAGTFPEPTSLPYNLYPACCNLFQAYWSIPSYDLVLSRLAQAQAVLFSYTPTNIADRAHYQAGLDNINTAIYALQPTHIDPVTVSSALSSALINLVGPVADAGI